MGKLSPDLLNSSLKPGPKRTRSVKRPKRSAQRRTHLSAALGRSTSLRLSALCREAASPCSRPPGCAPGAQRVPAEARARRVTGPFSDYSGLISCLMLVNGVALLPKASVLVKQFMNPNTHLFCNKNKF